MVIVHGDAIESDWICSILEWWQLLIKIFPNEFAKKLKSMFCWWMEEWNDIKNSKWASRARKVLKVSIVKSNKSSKWKDTCQWWNEKLCCQFRISAHKFPIETGRYINTERQNRVCTLCERGIGDELHYFSTCKQYSFESVSTEIYWSHKKNKRFSLFNETNIAICALMFHDDIIIVNTAKYVKQLMITFWHVGNRLNMSKCFFVLYILLVTVDVGLIM